LAQAGAQEPTGSNRYLWACDWPCDSLRTDDGNLMIQHIFGT